MTRDYERLLEIQDNLGFSNNALSLKRSLYIQPLPLIDRRGGGYSVRMKRYLRADLASGPKVPRLCYRMSSSLLSPFDPRAKGFVRHLDQAALRLISVRSLTKLDCV